MAVVPGVLLDHMGVDPAQRALLAVTQAGVVEVEPGGVLPAARALLLPDGEVGGVVAPSRGTIPLSSTAGS